MPPHTVLRIEGTGELRLRERLPGTGEIVELATFSYEEGVPEVYTDLVANEQITVYRVSNPRGLDQLADRSGAEPGGFPDRRRWSTSRPRVRLPQTPTEVQRGDDRNEILARMRASQEAILAEVWEDRVEDLPIATPEEALILASIIEKETSVPDERRQVSSVFVNRLNRGMRLQDRPDGDLTGSRTGGGVWAAASGNRSCGTKIRGTPT